MFLLKKKIFFPEPASQFQSNLVQIIIGEKGIQKTPLQFCIFFIISPLKGHVLFKGDIITKMQKWSGVF
jgi:ABC-type iron transport system FetAB ATPase subunit